MSDPNVPGPMGLPPLEDLPRAPAPPAAARRNREIVRGLPAWDLLPPPTPVNARRTRDQRP